MLREGPVQPTVPDVLVSRMVRTVVPEGTPWNPPPACCANSHTENASGSFAVPAEGAPHATVALAVTSVESMPRIGANQWSVGWSVVTVTRAGLLARTGGAVVASPALAATRESAVACMFPQAPRAQSWATASA